MTIGNKIDKMINDAQGAVMDDLVGWRNHLPSETELYVLAAAMMSVENSFITKADGAWPEEGQITHKN